MSGQMPYQHDLAGYVSDLARKHMITSIDREMFTVGMEMMRERQPADVILDTLKPMIHSLERLKNGAPRAT